MKDLSDSIVSALFDLAESDGGLVKSRAVERVREVLAAAEQVNDQHPILSAADEDVMSAMGTVPGKMSVMRTGPGTVFVSGDILRSSGLSAIGTVQGGGHCTLHRRQETEDEKWERIAVEIIKRQKKEDADEIAAAMTCPPKKPP